MPARDQINRLKSYLENPPRDCAAWERIVREEIDRLEVVSDDPVRARGRVKIIGDGSFKGTRVEDDMGEVIPGIMGIKWELSNDHPLAHAEIRVARPLIDMEATADVVEISKARTGLARLLQRYPHWEVVQIDGQAGVAVVEWIAAPRAPAFPLDSGPWLRVDLHDAGTVHSYAIWKETGNVYDVDEHGAVHEAPFIEVTPL